LYYKFNVSAKFRIGVKEKQFKKYFKYHLNSLSKVVYVLWWRRTPFTLFVLCCQHQQQNGGING